VTELEVDLRAEIGTRAIDVAFRAAGRPLIVVGPNGAGKTSLLLAILGALPPREGRVTLGGVTLYDRAGHVDVPLERRQIGFLPQRYALFPHLDVVRNVAYGVVAPSRDERLARAREALRELDAADLGARRPSELSGGETQRVALARALASRPRALLLDEPLAALDAAVRREMRRFLAHRLATLAIPTVVVTHDRADAETLDGDLVVVEGGAVVQRGQLRELAAAPRTEFVRRFLSETV
jgi:molybdate transport system ATP-binding protein